LRWNKTVDKSGVALPPGSSLSLSSFFLWLSFSLSRLFLASSLSSFSSELLPPFLWLLSLLSPSFSLSFSKLSSQSAFFLHQLLFLNSSLQFCLVVHVCAFTYGGMIISLLVIFDSMTCLIQSLVIQIMCFAETTYILFFMCFKMMSKWFYRIRKWVFTVSLGDGEIYLLMHLT
jgi:hypothetical protein